MGSFLKKEEFTAFLADVKKVRTNDWHGNLDRPGLVSEDFVREGGYHIHVRGLTDTRTTEPSTSHLPLMGLDYFYRSDEMKRGKWITGAEVDAQFKTDDPAYDDTPAPWTDEQWAEYHAKRAIERAPYLAEQRKKIRQTLASYRRDPINLAERAAELEISEEEVVLNSLSTIMYFIDRLEGDALNNIDFHETLWGLLQLVSKETILAYRNILVNKYTQQKNGLFEAIGEGQRFSDSRKLYEQLVELKDLLPNL